MCAFLSPWWRPLLLFFSTWWLQAPCGFGHTPALFAWVVALPFPSSVSSASLDPGPPFFALPCVPKQKTLPGCSVQWGWARVLCLRAEPQPSTQQLPAITQTRLLSCLSSCFELQLAHPISPLPWLWTSEHSFPKSDC